MSIVISAIIVAASGGTGLLGGTWLSSLGMGGGAMLAGAVSGGIMTGSWQGAMKGAIFGAFSAGVANAVVDTTASMMSVSSAAAHKATLLKAGMRGVALTKSLLHGLSRGAINTLQGGTFKAGFASGFASSGFDVGTQGHGGFVGRTTIMGIVGGTASAIGGGKFSNGAVSGAFVHMFNGEGGVKKVKTFFETASASISLAFGLTIETGTYHNSTEKGVLLTFGGLSGVDASVNLKGGYVNGNASALDGWFTSVNQSIVFGEGTILYSSGEYVGISGGASYGPFPYSATVSRTYTVRIPFKAPTYQEQISNMVHD